MEKLDGVGGMKFDEDSARVNHLNILIKGKKCNKESLDKRERGNKIAPLWHKC